MSRITALIGLGLMLSLQVFAADTTLDGFKSRFTLLRNEAGKITVIKLNRVISHFSIMPFIQQLKADLTQEQQSFLTMDEASKEKQIDGMLAQMGYNLRDKSSDGYEEALRTKESFLNIKNINIEAAFSELDRKDFWKEFEAKLNEAFLFIDPSVLANLDDPRFFYKKQVVYRVIVWALEQAKQRFSNIPVLNIASFVIVRAHDMIMEQRHFHHNMLLHYFELIPETKLGMTKEEVDRAVSSIYEYRIDAASLPESNRAAQDWLNYGMNNFYRMVRSANNRVSTWDQNIFSNVDFSGVKKINFGFAEVTDKDVRKIYHLQVNAHKFSRKPALAHDFSKPQKVKQIRAILNLSGVALGFVQMPGWLKGQVESFLQSMYVNQVRMEGALVAHFESTGNQDMIKHVYRQRANFYILE